MSEQIKNNNEWSNQTSSIVSHEKFGDAEGLFRCTCGSLSHTVSIVRFDNKDDYDEVFLSIILSNWRNFFQRLSVAFSYIFFDQQPSDGVFGVNLIRSRDFNDLCSVLNVNPRFNEYIDSMVVNNRDWQLQAWFSQDPMPIEEASEKDMWSELCIGIFFHSSNVFSRLKTGLWYVFYTRSRYREEEFELNAAQRIRLAQTALRHKQAVDASLEQ